MVWVRVIAVLACAFLLAGLAVYGFLQVQQELYERGMLERVPGGPRSPISIGDVAAYGAATLAPLASAALLWRAFVERGRLLGVVRYRDFVRHLLVFGPTGSGKTTVAKKALIMSLRHGSRVVVLDWKGEYVGFVKGATVIRKMEVFTPADWEGYEQHAMAVVDILSDVLDLTEPQSFTLYNALVELYELRKGQRVTATDVMNHIGGLRDRALTQRNVMQANICEALMRRILPLTFDDRRRASNTRGSESVVIYDLSCLPTYHLKSLYGLIILWRLYREAARSPAAQPSLRSLVIVEESQNFVRPRRAERPPGIGERVVNELRSYGYGVLMLSPDPTQLPWHLARDAGAVISIGYQGLPEFLSDLLSFYRYADAKRLIRVVSKPRAYVFSNSRLHVKELPKPVKGTVDLGVEAVEEVVEPAVEPLRLGDGPKAAGVEAARCGERCAVEEPRRRSLALFGHDVEEVELGGDVSYLRCTACGLTVPITDAARLKENACSGEARTRAPADGANGYHTRREKPTFFRRGMNRLQMVIKVQSESLGCGLDV